MWLEPMKNGKFKAAERYIDPMTGKTRRVTTIIEKDTKACRRAAEAVLRDKIDQATQVKKDADITLQELSTLFVQHQKDACRETTEIRDASILRGVIEAIGPDVQASKLTARFIDQQLRKTGKDNVGLNTYLKTLKRMLRWSYRMEYLEDVSYLDRLPAYPDPEKKLRIEDKYLSSDELKAVLNGMKVRRWKLLTEFLALSGLRIGEAMALNDSDVDDYIHVNKTYHLTTDSISDNPKTSAGYREVFIQPELASVIERIRAFVKEYNFACGYRNDLFLSVFGYNTYRKYLKENTEKIVGRVLTPHALRHTHVSLLAEQGYPLDAISRRVGHEDSKITKEIYLHVTEKQKEKDNEQLRRIRIL